MEDTTGDEVILLTGAFFPATAAEGGTLAVVVITGLAVDNMVVVVTAGLLTAVELWVDDVTF